MKSIEARLAKLETGNRGSAIVVWCDDPADVEITVSAMIAEGQISVADRERLLLVASATDLIQRPGARKVSVQRTSLWS